MRRIQITSITNQFRNTLSTVLKDLLPRASTVDVQVAFITAEGVGEILSHLGQAARRGRVRILTGLYQGITEPEALDLLRGEQRRTNNRLQAHLSQNPRFHRKLYLIRSGKELWVIVGSSNLTSDGLTSSGEFDLVLRLPSNDRSAKTLLSMFDAMWVGDSRPVTRERIASYRDQRSRRSTTKITVTEIKEILRGRDKRPKPRSNIGHWCYVIDGLMGQQTEKLLVAETNWDRHHYEWCSWVNLSMPSDDDKLLILDKPSGYAFPANVVASATLHKRTPEGRRFVAFRQMRQRRNRRMSKALWENFRRYKLKITHKSRSRRMTQSQWNRALSCFSRRI